MHVTPEYVAEECAWTHERASTVVPLIDDLRSELGALFDAEVGTVTAEQYHDAVDTVFADGDLAVNVAALIGLLRDLDVEGDYSGFVVDEWLGRRLAGTIAGGQPLGLLGEATFHVADVYHHGSEDDPAGADDLDAALAAGFQTRLPGWAWTDRESPFAVER